MNKFQEEKLRKILNSECGRKESHEAFKITIRFQNHSSETHRDALELARRNRYFHEADEGIHHHIYASFYPEDVNDLYRMFELVKNLENTRLYLNNKSIPYTHELWLFLMWFYRVS
ncbi:MAG: hypothetical protein ACM3SY_08585 [Candidatus Omnitrophota bacterium]